MDNEELKQKLLKLIAEKPVNYAQCCSSKAYRELHDAVLDVTKSFPQDVAFKIRIFWIFKRYSQPLKCCICGKIIDKDIGTLENGYNKNKKWEQDDEKFVACPNESCIKQARNLKIKNTCLEKYGVSNMYMVEQFKEKSKRTCMDRYSVPYGGNSPEGRAKARNTCMKNYGVAVPFKSDIIKQKVKRTCIEKYGQSSFAKTDEYRNLKKEKHIEKLAAQLFRDPEIEFLDVNEFQNLQSAYDIWNVEFSCRCRKCGNIFKYWYWNYNIGGHILESRMKFQKHKLKNILKDYGESLTEKQNMENNGYYRIYDCGNLVYFKKVSKNI